MNPTPVQGGQPNPQLMELWAKKGQLVTQIEIAQQQLQQVNLQLQSFLNTQAPPA